VTQHPKEKARQHRWFWFLVIAIIALGARVLAAEAQMPPVPPPSGPLPSALPHSPIPGASPDCVQDPQSCLHQSAWFLDQDNTMVPISTEEGVGAAMATVIYRDPIHKRFLISQGIQVCEGVYLMTAHGALQNLLRVAPEHRSPLPYDPATYVCPYPIREETCMLSPKDPSQYISPRLTHVGAWKDFTKDYLLMKMDQPLRPEHVVRPVRASVGDLVKAFRERRMETHLYRGATLYPKDEKGFPDWSETPEDWKFTEVYKTPYRVAKPCKLSYGPRSDRTWSLQTQCPSDAEECIEKKIRYETKNIKSLVGSSCPMEVNVSGSPFVTTLNGKNYLLGIALAAIIATLETFNDSNSNRFLPSIEFCEDYERVCGEPCAELEDVLP